MKKSIIRTASFSALVSAAMSFTACTQIDDPQGPSTPDQKEITEEGTFTVNFECSLPDEDEATRTEFHDNTIWWSEGDQAKFFQYAQKSSEFILASANNAKLTESKNILAIAASFNTPDDGTDSYYFSAFPAGMCKGFSTSSGKVRMILETPAQQTPTASSYDPNADLLISQYTKNLEKNSEGKYYVRLKYKRMVAIAKMTIKNLQSANAVSSIEFSAKDGGTAVTAAGQRWYDFDSGTWTSEVSAEKKKAITLDYSGQNITANTSDGMTAYFMCYPFELAAGDSFKVVVTTTAGEIFTREVTLPSGRTLGFNEGKGSVFSVNMATAEKTCEWLSLSPYSSGSYVPTIEKTYAALKGSDIASVKWCTANMATFNGITDFDTYIESNGTVLSDASIINLNSNKTLVLSKTGTIDTEYAFIVKATNNAGQSVILTTTARTDWFKLALVKNSGTNAGVQIQITAVNVSIQSRAWRIVPTSTLEGISDLESYLMNTLKPGLLNTTYVDAINAQEGAIFATNTAKYHTGSGTTTADMVAGTNYTILMRLQNERGETAFRTASAIAN